VNTAEVRDPAHEQRVEENGTDAKDEEAKKKIEDEVK